MQAGHDVAPRNPTDGVHEPLVSVIMPAYNCALYVAAALDSMLHQTEQRLEIIVIDDGSEDGTAGLVEQYTVRDSRVRLLRRAVPSGRPSVARNEGLRLARGKYVAFQDADDIALATRLSATLHAMEVGGARMAFADMIRFDNRTGVCRPRSRLKLELFVERAMRYLEPLTPVVYRCKPAFIGFMLSEMAAVNTQTCIFERSLLDDEPVWFDEGRLCAEDTDLFYRLATRAQMVFVNEVLSLYRIHAQSLTARLSERTLRDGAEVRLANVSRFKGRLSEAEIKGARALVGRIFSEIGYSHWCDGNLEDARAAYRQSWFASASKIAAKGYVKAFVSRDLIVSALDRIQLVLRGVGLWSARSNDAARHDFAAEERQEGEDTVQAGDHIEVWLARERLNKLREL